MDKNSETPKKIKLLIVDDEVDFLQSIAKRLEIRDFDITTATNGEEAIQATNQKKFDLALLDLKMPGMHGTEVLAKLKKKHKWLEVIILTGHGSIDSAVECTKLGAFGYLAKPYDLEELIEVLKQAFEERLKKKFKHDKKRSDELAILSMGDSPIGILRSLLRLDDDEK
jgi:DNA-binding NtrC family response regulator